MTPSVLIATTTPVESVTGLMTKVSSSSMSQNWDWAFLLSIDTAFFPYHLAINFITWPKSATLELL